VSCQVWAVLSAIALFGAYREFCTAKFYFARRRAQRERRRGLRLVISRREHI
jgi:hypothetical protein